jgi:dolichol-phosphate mannosyltransferase
MRNRTIAIIPAYNEEKNIAQVVRRSLKFADVCVVDDGSRDKTAEIVMSIPKAKCIRHVKNTHIAQAILDGMRYALENNYDYIITMDAGLSHKPEELINFIKAPHSDLTMGIRSVKSSVPLYRRFLSFLANLMFNMAMQTLHTKPMFHDVTSGFRRYSKKSVRLLLGKRLRSKAFDFHTEVLVIIFRNGLTINEIPISYEFTGSSFNYKVLKNEFKMLLYTLFRKIG